MAHLPSPPAHLPGDHLKAFLIVRQCQNPQGFLSLLARHPHCHFDDRRRRDRTERDPEGEGRACRRKRPPGHSTKPPALTRGRLDQDGRNQPGPGPGFRGHATAHRRRQGLQLSPSRVRRFPPPSPGFHSPDKLVPCSTAIQFPPSPGAAPDSARAVSAKTPSALTWWDNAVLGCFNLAKTCPSRIFPSS